MLSIALTLAACSGGAPRPPAGETVAPLTQTAVPCDEDHAVALLRPSTVRVSTATTTGTGIVVDTGVVLTYDHVVARAGAVTIFTAEGPYPASVRSEDSANDLATISVPGLALPSVRWGDPGGLVAGQRLLSLTYADETSGAASTTSGGFTGMRTVGGAQFVSTDTPADADNTGGPLLNLCGAVVGMNTLSARTGPLLAIPSSVLSRAATAAP